MRIVRPLLALFLVFSAGCPRKEDRPAPVALAPAVTAPATPAPTEEACVDAFLKAKGLDRYGSPEGTAYTGGTPLFDERTGETKDRLTHVYGLQPEAAAACRRDR